MKYGIFLGSSILIFSTLIVLIFYRLFFYDFFIEINYTPKELDRNELLTSELFIKNNLSEFDNTFFNILSGNKNLYNKMINNIYKINDYKLNENISENLNIFIRKSIDYYIEAMHSKITITQGDLLQSIFLDAFKKVEYNYSAAEATFRIAENFLKIEDKLFFMPDVVSKNIINNGSCMLEDENAEEYEIALRWFVAFSALSASFNTEYLKILNGKKFFSKKDIILTLYNMRNIIDTMKKCNPPEYLIGSHVDSYNLAFYSFEKKLDIAEYYGLSSFPNMKEVNILNNNINSFGSISNVLLSSVGYDSFKTLAIVVLFELYSKE